MAETIIESLENFGLSKKDKKKALFSKIGLVGCGRDGQNIVALVASAGIEVVFVEVSEERIQYATKKIERILDNRIDNWGLTSSEKRAIMGRVNGSLVMTDLKDCDFVIECIRYDDETGERSTKMRKEVFKELESILSPEAIIATNATTVIISELASDLKYKNRCISLHFMIGNPDAKILEVVKGFFTSDEVLTKILTFSKMIKHEAITIHESNGLVGQRLLVVMLNEACEMLMQNVCDLESIDKMVQIGFGQRQGVFRLADIIGIEKIVMLMEDMFNEYGDKKYKPSPILWRLYRSKQLGIHTGKGFYIYEGGVPVRANTF